MRHLSTARISRAAGAAACLSLLLASAAMASGPATSHRGTVTADCGGQTYTVAVENGGQNVGVGQVVDAFGHAILVNGTSTVTDTSTQTVLETWFSGHGSGHDRQTQTECVVTIWYTASDAFGSALPPGVGATDAILYEMDFWVVLQI